MAGTTPTGYHRPVGSDPLEPATLATRATDPTDEGLLAQSLELAHPRGSTITAPGDSRNTTGALALGTLTTSLSGAAWYTGAAPYSLQSSGTVLRVAGTGEYELHATVVLVGTGGSGTVRLSSSNFDITKTWTVTSPAVTGGQDFSVVFDVTTAPADVALEVKAISDAAAIVRCVKVRRRGPVLS